MLRTFTGAIAVFFTVLVGSAVPVSAERDSEHTIAASTWRSYGEAIRDAAVSRPGEVVTDLLVPTPEDPRTQWTTFDGEQYMQVQTVSHRAISTVAAGEIFSTGSDVWIAVPGEMDEVCADYGCAHMNVDELDMTFKQVLGLPPDADYSALSRFWVRPTDLVRPCTNVDPMVASCPQLMTNTVVGGVDYSNFLFGQAVYAWREPRRGKSAPRISCAQDYENTTNGNCYGFPWTRLGYTYDWTPGAQDDRGVTEFVVPEGATVYLESVGTQREAFPYRRS